jgi:hypothetical protein
MSPTDYHLLTNANNPDFLQVRYPIKQSVVKFCQQRALKYLDLWDGADYNYLVECSSIDEVKRLSGPVLLSDG